MSKIENTNKSLSSAQEAYKTSYSYEIKVLREKISHWKRASEMHYLEGFHISGALYKEYMLKAMQELADVLKQEQEQEVYEVIETRKPRKFFISQTTCNSYNPVLSSFEILNRKEVEQYFINEDKIPTYESIPHLEITRIS